MAGFISPLFMDLFSLWAPKGRIPGYSGIQNIQDTECHHLLYVEFSSSLGPAVYID